jgi:transposase
VLHKTGKAHKIKSLGKIMRKLKRGLLYRKNKLLIAAILFLGLLIIDEGSFLYFFRVAIVSIAFSRLVRYDSYLLLFPNILIMKPHSIAFRQKIIEVHEVEDISQRKLAKRFNVALSFIQKLLKQYRETDSLAPKVRTQQTPAKLNNEHLTVLRRLVEERNDATLEELRKQLIHETGIDVSRSTVDRALDKLGLTLKKRRSMLTRRKLSESSLSV